jgi:hypothetical protein
MKIDIFTVYYNIKRDIIFYIIPKRYCRPKPKDRYYKIVQGDGLIIEVSDRFIKNSTFLGDLL